jgi:hypothetical protein
MNETFPLDDVTLTLLRSSCQINPDSGHTELLTFLSMGERVKSRTPIGDAEGTPIYEVEFEDGFEPWSVHSVIKALVDEVLRLRSTGRPNDD